LSSCEIRDALTTPQASRVLLALNPATGRMF
jgi:hypothetical protein